jgi:sigma-B regulation protein RsbU (phosphoserine phosphatase)
MKGMSRGQTAVLAALTLLMAAVCVASFVTPASWLNKPFAGFLVYDPPYVGSYSVEDWPGRRAGLKFLDRIVAVDGAPVWKGQEIVDAVRQKEPGTPVRYLVESKGERREVTIPVVTYRLKDFLLTFLVTNFTCGFLLCVLGVVVVLLKPNIYTSWVFMVWSFCLGGYLISGFEIMSSYRLVNFHYVLACLYPIMALHLAFIFPDRKGIVVRYPIVEYLIYAPIAVLVAGWQIYLEFFPGLLRSSSALSTVLCYKFLGSMTRLLLLLCVASFIAVTIHSSFRASSIVARRRARVILSGAVVGWLGPVVIMLGSHILKVNPTWNFLPFLVVFFPVSVTYSIVRHNLFDADVIIRRTMGYAVVTAVVVGAYALVSVSFNVLMGKYDVSQSRAFPVAFTMGVILVFNPLRDRIQAVVDRIFFRAEYDYGAVVDGVSRAMTSMLDMGEILARLTKTFIDEMFIDTGSVMLLSTAGTEYAVRLADGEKKEAVEGFTIGRDDPLMEIIENEKRELTLYDILEDPRFKSASESGSADFEALHASMIVPLVYQDKVIGMLGLGEKKSGKSFNHGDIELLRTLASQGAVAIENARLFQENLEKQRMEEELSIARDLQMSMLPATCPQVKGFEIAALSSPAKEVGGDFFDFIEMGDERLGIVVADVTGKSVSGALVMSASRSVFRMLSEEDVGIGGIMTRANRRLKKDITSGMFVALLYAVLEVPERVLRLCSAGQTQPVHISGRTGEARLMETEGDTFPLGILEDTAYEETRIPLEPGDTVILYTDGIVEAMDGEEKIFGFDRLMEMVRGKQTLSADSLLKEILDQVGEFAAGAEQHDDLTVIVLKAADQTSR